MLKTHLLIQRVFTWLPSSTVFPVTILRVPKQGTTLFFCSWHLIIVVGWTPGDHEQVRQLLLWTYPHLKFNEQLHIVFIYEDTYQKQTCSPEDTEDNHWHKSLKWIIMWTWFLCRPTFWIILTKNIFFMDHYYHIHFLPTLILHSASLGRWTLSQLVLGRRTGRRLCWSSDELHSI